MASIAQNVLMALTATVNKFASSNVQAVPRGEGWRRKPRATPADSCQSVAGTRRCLLLLSAVAVGDSRTEILEKYLKKSEENKSKNDKEVWKFSFFTTYLEFVLAILL
ncbi:hypothetical protein EUGRSUZ_G01203 [Eucalyptus grandis]|uniref:Uncharacterized protein n=2 Tax=Eucalyptus grandis TaxID=71139 RepID=A0ACC3K373_EUCGR|nr:hypothetical protein EUGRSUZ_G01203 [Eucalyptus grandis]